MEFRGDDRGVTVQIGAVLLFGILIIALATVQVTVVPDENAATEFEHNLDAQEGMAELRNALLAAGTSGDPASASVPLGTTYQQRTFLINPPPARGTIRTAGTGDPRVNVTLDNARADSPYPNANAYWNGTARTYDTGAIVYTPNYNEYREAPVTVYENTLVANVFDGDRTLERTGQTLVRGNRINLLTVNGTLQENGVTAQSVDARPLSAYTNTVTVRSGEDPLWINITSRLSATTWETRVLAEQMDASGNVADVVPISNETRDGVTYHRLGIKLASNTTYELRGASVAVGAVSERNKQPRPTYLVVTDEYETVGNGSTGKVTVQVRDQFNNPVDGFAVNGTLDTEHLRFVDETGAEVNSTSVTTDEDGYATFTYTAVQETGASETAWLNVSMLGGGAEYRYTNFSERKVPVFGGGDGDGSSDLVNPGSSGDVILTGSRIQNGDYVVFTLNNTKTTAATLTYARLEFYYTPDNTIGYTEAAIANGSQADSFTTDPAAVLEVGGDYARLQPTIRVNPGEQDVTMEFRADDPTGNPSVERDEFFVLTLVFEVNGETERYRYFVDPE